MACTLSIGRAEKCKDSVGGLLAVYAIPYGGELGMFKGGTSRPRNASGNTVIPLAIKTYLHGNNTLDTEIITSRDSGTSFERQTLVLNLKKADAELYRMLRNTADRYFFGVITRDKQDELRLVGTAPADTNETALLNHKGAEISQIEWTSGSAMGDFNGATVTITSEVPFGDLSGSGYAKGITIGQYSLYDPKLIDTYDSFTLDSDVSITDTTVAEADVVVDGDYFNPITGELVGVVDAGATLTLTRGKKGTYAKPMLTGQTLYKIA